MVEDFEKIKEMECILFSLKQKEKLNERMEEIYKFIIKSKYIFFNGYHSCKINLMFFEEVISFFYLQEGNSNKLVINGKIINVKNHKPQKNQ